MTTVRLIAILLFVEAFPLVAAAQEAPVQKVDTTALAKATQNPVGDLISLPFQFNFNTAGDLGDRTFFNLNFQPVIPFSVSSDWNMIARTIITIDSIPGTDPGVSFSGVGDIQEQLYFTPKKAGAIGKGRDARRSARPRG
jgi:hypothetical protein